MATWYKKHTVLYNTDPLHLNGDLRPIRLGRASFANGAIAKSRAPEPGGAVTGCAHVLLGVLSLWGPGDATATRYDTGLLLRQDCAGIQVGPFQPGLSFCPTKLAYPSYPPTGSNNSFWVYQINGGEYVPPTAGGEPVHSGPSPPGTPVTARPPTKLYVADGNDDQVIAIDLNSYQAECAIAVPGGPEGIATTPDGTMAYVTEPSSNAVVPINLTDSAVGTPITVSGVGLGIAVAPDGRTIYVTSAADNTLTPVSFRAELWESERRLRAPAPSSNRPEKQRHR